VVLEIRVIAAPSVVAMTLVARSAFSIAWFTPWISLRSRSLTISPDGSSAPRLICSPVLSRVRLSFRLVLLTARLRWARSEATLVLIRDMVGPLGSGGRYSGETGEET